ncbi:MAG TPA: hypothetical protein VMV22_14460 [Acidimicrobiales bacterium]|nr:hypothetical protein [Acidimicrobiales bacterium]
MDGSVPRDQQEPPDDPEAWTHEQWITWLEATDDPDEGAARRGAGGRRWRDRRPAGVLGAAMLGLRDAIYGRPDDEVVIVADAGGDPPGDDLHEVHLDLEHPERSEVVVRRRRPPEAGEGASHVGDEVQR